MSEIVTKLPGDDYFGIALAVNNLIVMQDARQQIARYVYDCMSKYAGPNHETECVKMLVTMQEAIAALQPGYIPSADQLARSMANVMGKLVFDKMEPDAQKLWLNYAGQVIESLKAISPPAPASSAEREELAKWCESEADIEDGGGIISTEYSDLMRRLVRVLRAPAPVAVTDEMVERAAPSVAKAMGKDWEYFSEAGRRIVRAHTRAILADALSGQEVK